MLGRAGFRIRYVNFYRQPELQPDVSRYNGVIVVGGPVVGATVAAVGCGNVVLGPTVVAVDGDGGKVVDAGSGASSAPGVASACAIRPTPANVAVTLKPVATTLEATAVRGRRRALTSRPASR